MVKGPAAAASMVVRKLREESTKLVCEAYHVALLFPALLRDVSILSFLVAMKRAGRVTNLDLKVRKLDSINAKIMNFPSNVGVWPRERALSSSRMSSSLLSLPTVSY